jgi:predicted HicB family RNase H-like nuclease
MTAQPEHRQERRNLVIPEALHRRAKAAAALAGLPLSQFATSALQREIERAERLQQRRR